MSQEEDPLTREFKQLRENATWLMFMEKVKQELPFLFESGRPKIEVIRKSVIGHSGCNSWSDYLSECLDWNESGWQAWRRAYKVVLEYPYLREVKATPSLINLRARTEETFPVDINAWYALQQALDEKKHESRIDKLEKRVTALELALNQQLEQTD